MLHLKTAIFSLILAVIWNILVFRRVSHWIDKIACWRKLSVILVGLLALGINLAVLLIYINEPSVHDEFSYLLAADTFASGRLSNPTHPMWVHFESMHIIHQPTYASKYPPAQGLLLAVGKIIGGHPIVGVHISIALACAAIYWMLQAWLPPRWAFLGGLVTIGHLGGFNYWSQTYWGGAVAAFGGALVFGALRRVMQQPSVWNSALMGAGLVILANTRPFEGLVVSIPVAVAMLAWLVGKNRPAVRISMSRVVLPIFVILALAGGAMGYYNFRVTGDAFRTPYQVHDKTYGVIPFFFWQSPASEPSYNHKVMADFYTDENNPYYLRRQSIQGFAEVAIWNFKILWDFYLGFFLTIPLGLVLWSKDQWIWFALLICNILMATFLIVHNSMWPHYAAPVTGLVFVVVLEGMRHLYQWKWHGGLVGRFIVLIILMSIIVTQVFQLQLVLHWIHSPDTETVHQNRIFAQLDEEAGHHLVIVRYGPKRTSPFEWVYNEANIDSAKIVWAREMDTKRNHELLKYFTGRRVWLLQADKVPAKLVPYPGGSVP